MLVPRAETLEGKAEILRSVRLPQPTAAVVVALALVLLLVLLVDAEAASALKGRLPVHQVATALVAEVVALPPQASML